MPAKKVPMRMCVGCREMKPKKELLRIVRSPEGEISVDRTGKVSGRGAYICANAECLNRARKSAYQATLARKEPLRTKKPS